MRAKLQQTLYVIMLTTLMSSCASVYMPYNAKEITITHEKVAILTPKVLIRQRRFDDLGLLQETQKSSAIQFQYALYNYLLKRKSKGQMFVDIQHVGETNHILNENG